MLKLLYAGLFAALSTGSLYTHPDKTGITNNNNLPSGSTVATEKNNKAVVRWQKDTGNVAIASWKEALQNPQQIIKANYQKTHKNH